MTGFGSAAATPSTEGGAASGGVQIEVRSVNSRFLDLAFRLPDELRQIEPALREALTAALRRGKVEVRGSLGRGGDDSLPQPSSEQLSRLARLESQVACWLPKAAPLSVHEALQWCRGSAGAAPRESLDELALQAGRQAIIALKDARAREGERLVAILMERIDALRALAAQAAPLIPAVVKKQQERFLDRWNEALDSAGAGAQVSAESARDRAL
ncbi:MAG: hypothetical protein J0M20_05475, partial [Burkholderiales bacterium]|nr:hypothetical protein [Burkholderiales bacterium]